MNQDDAERLARSFLSYALPARWSHVEGVVARARRLCELANVRSDALVSAAWLHDLGYAASLAETGFHPLDGARYLKEHGWTHNVCCLVANHTDATLQASRLGLADVLQAEFPNRASVERDILWVADATTGSAGQLVTLEERIQELRHRYGPDGFVTTCMIASRPVLSATIDRVHDMSITFSH